MGRLMQFALGLMVLLFLWSCTAKPKPDMDSGKQTTVGTEAGRGKTDEPAATDKKDGKEEDKVWTCPRCGQTLTKGKRCSFCDKHK